MKFKNSRALKYLRPAVQLISLGIFVYLFINLVDETLRPLASAVLAADPIAALTAVIFFRATWTPALLGVAVLIIGSLVLGRAFCGWVCPVGLVADLASIPWKKVNSLLRRKPSNPRFGRLQYTILAAVLLTSTVTMISLTVLDPFSILKRTLYFASGAGLPDVILLVLLGSLLVVPRFWCRAICPTGALLGLVSPASPFKFKALGGCKNCTKCSQACRMGAISKDLKWDSTACIKCLDCQRTCPVNQVSFSPARRNRALPATPTAQKAETVSLSRRSLLTTGALLGMTAVAGSVARADPPAEQPLIRPPGSLVEARFNASCIRCGACVQACPQNPKVLELVGFDRGLEKFYTPALNFQKNSCTLCGACVDACPNGTLRLVEGEKLKIGTCIRDHRCSSWNGGGCSACIRYCPYGAIVKIGDYYVTTIEEKCTGCGACEHLCSYNKVVNNGEIRRET